MEHKAWIDVKSPRFFIWKAIQYIGLIGSGVKTLIPPTYTPNMETLRACDIIISSFQGRGVAICYEKQHINPAKTV